MSVQMRDGSVADDPRLARLELFDPASRNYTIREVIDDPATRRDDRGRYHFPGPTLNQRAEGQCVSEAIHDEANGSPNRLKPPVVDFVERHRAYHEMQHNDPWAGCSLGAACPIQPDPANSYGGTSVLTGLKYGQAKGWWREYRWLGAGSGRLEDDLIDALRLFGGVVFGIPWLDGMYETNPDGLVDVSGSKVGGHAIRGWEWLPRLRLPRSFTGTKPAVALHNSWGPERHEEALPGVGWGVTRRRVTGTGYILLDDLLSLMEQRGEGAVTLQ